MINSTTVRFVTRPMFGVVTTGSSFHL